MDTPQGGKSNTNSGDGVAAAVKAQGNHHDKQDAREKLMSDMKSVITEAEQWLQTSAAQAGDGLQDARDNFDVTLQAAKTDLLRLESTMLARARIAAKATDTYVKDNPWQAVGIVAAVGMLFGLLITRD